MKTITLGNGKRVALSQYAAAIQQVKASPAGSQFTQGLTGFWPTTREEILRDFFQMVTDRINRFSTIPTLSDSRLRQLKRKHLTSDCRNCDNRLPVYQERDSRFCSGKCRAEFYA